MNNRRPFTFQRETFAVDLATGESREVEIREMTLPETKEFFNTLIDAVARCLFNRGTKWDDLNKDVAAAFKMPPDELRGILLDEAVLSNPDIWRHVFHTEDVDFVNQIQPTHLVAILACFLELNPLIEQKKKALSMRLTG